MSGMVSIAVRDLKPGDRIKVLDPPNVARVISAAQHPANVMICAHGKKSWMPNANMPGWIVDFEYLDGPIRGQRNYTWQHPDDRIYTA